MKVEIITIGDEILQGQIVDTNSAWIARQLLALHIPVVQITSIADRATAIVEAFDQARTRADLILITGGLGPTRDDVTKQTAAKYFNTRLVRDERVLQHVKDLFRQLNRQMPLINEAQADVFEAGDVLFNALGTAPGLWIIHQGIPYVFMPGVPFEMKHVMKEQVLPRLTARLGTRKIGNWYVLTAGIGESQLAETISDIEEELPAHIRLAYLPRLGVVRLRLTGTGDREDLLERQLEDFAIRIKERIPEYFISFGNIELEQAVLEAMAAKGLTLATAESCTGGNIARKITAIPGASKVFQGSVVAYANTVKTAILNVDEGILRSEGAVSEAAVRAMAVGVRQRLQVDYAIATSGIAGPDGGTAEKKVGTIWVAVCSRRHTQARCFHFHNDRELNIDRATTQALIMLWNALKGTSD